MQQGVRLTLLTVPEQNPFSRNQDQIGRIAQGSQSCHSSNSLQHSVTMNLLHFPPHFIVSLASLLVGSQRPKKGTQGESSRISSATYCFTQCKGRTHARRDSVLTCNNNLAVLLQQRVCGSWRQQGSDGFSCDGWEKFWGVLKARSLDVHFTIATFNSKNKSVITISLSYCGANWICWKYRAKQIIW